MEVPDISVMSAGEKPRKYSIGNLYDPDEIEKITVKPSTELIPDEYEHDDNKKGLVLIFYSRKDVGNMKGLKQALSDQEYDVPDSNLYEITTKDFVLRSLGDVAQMDHKDKSCFILIFLGNFENGRDDRFLADDETDKKSFIPIRDVWSLFTSDNCPTLRYKPKIFIFQGSKKFQAIHDDGLRMLRGAPPHGGYDIPAEADILLVYKKVEDPMHRNHFIEQLCNNIHDDGHKDDMIGIVTHTHQHKREKRPLIISTLTRKFYVRPSNQRGHHHDLHENHDEVTKILRDLNEKINTIQEQQSAFKRKLEQRVSRRWQETLSATSKSNRSEDVTTQGRESPKTERSDSKRTSRNTSSASSIDSISKFKKSPKKPWKF